MREYRKKNREKILEMNRSYNLRVRIHNREKEREVKRRSYFKHREAKLLQCKEYRKRNAAKLRATAKRYEQLNKDRIRERKKAYYLKNKDRIRQRDQVFRVNNAEWIKERARRSKAKNKATLIAYNKRYNLENRERNRKSRRAWYIKNADRILIRQREYYRKNKDKYYAKTARRRARRIAATIGDIAALNEIYRRAKSKQAIACHYCKRDIPRGQRHVDHLVPLAKGGPHSAENLVIACQRCNLCKGTKLPHEIA